MFTKKNTPSEENFNGYAKILMAHMLYRRTTPEAYLKKSRTSTMELSCEKKNALNALS